MLRIIYILILGVFLISCSASRFVEPLEKDQLAVGVNFGGPMIDYGGVPIPIPLTSLEVGYGLRNKFTVYSGIHTTSMLFGNLQMDFGGTYKFMDQQSFFPNLSVSPSVNTIWVSGDNKFKAWPVLDVNAYWNYGAKKNYVYLGFNNYFELSRTKALDQPQGSPIVFSPQIGHVLKGKDHKWEFTTEIKFIAPYARNSYAFVPYTGVTGQYGSTGIYLGYRYFFSLNKKD